MFASTGATINILPSPANSSAVIVPGQDFLSKIGSMKIRELQKLAGRKFTLKEKLGIAILKHKLKKKSGDGSSAGQNAMIFGILALALFVIGLFVPFVIIGSFVSSILAIIVGSIASRKDRDDKKAFVGKLLGWITLGLIALLVALVIAAISAIF
jgi:hypothetical protein